MICWIYDIHPKEQFTPQILFHSHYKQRCRSPVCFLKKRLTFDGLNSHWLRVDILLPFISLCIWCSHSSSSAFRAQRLTNSTASNTYAISEQLLRERNVSIWMIVCLQRSHTHRLPRNGWSLGDFRFGLEENSFSRLGISQACVYLHSLNCSFDK